jgi:hypothetical protein
MTDESRRRVQGLQATVYGKSDPTSNIELYREAIKADASVGARAGRQKKESAGNGENEPPPQLLGRLLGPDTTGLSVKTMLHMQPLPTGIYNLLHPDRNPLLTVLVENTSDEPKPKRVCVKVYLEGLSAKAVGTAELGPGDKRPFKMHPTLLPHRARSINEIQRATLHVWVKDLDASVECHNSFVVVCLARTSSFNAVRRPDTGELVDLTHFYGAWVTPYAEVVQERIRRAADHLAEHQVWGYQGDLASVRRQVAALYQALKETDIAYVNSVIDFGNSEGLATQRTRLPRESLALKSANCIDGTVLMASLLEGASLNPAIVIVPGHAFVGWETGASTDEWNFLETTMIGTADFEAACKSGQQQYQEYQQHAPDRLKMHRLSQLRELEIWPME